MFSYLYGVWYYCILNKHACKGCYCALITFRKVQHVGGGVVIDFPICSKRFQIAHLFHPTAFRFIQVFFYFAKFSFCVVTCCFINSKASSFSRICSSVHSSTRFFLMSRPLVVLMYLLQLYFVWAFLVVLPQLSQIKKTFINTHPLIARS